MVLLFRRPNLKSISSPLSTLGCSCAPALKVVRQLVLLLSRPTLRSKLLYLVVRPPRRRLRRVPPRSTLSITITLGGCGSAVCPVLAFVVVVVQLLFCFVETGPITCATLSPTCVHGSCFDTTVGPFCTCSADADGFTFSGVLCDAPLCPSDCNAGIQQGYQ
jgi:hypothetical protein